MRWPRRLASALMVVVLLVGPPLLLVRLVGWPAIGGPRVAIWGWVRDPLTEQNLVLMVVVLAWALWAFVAYTVTVRTAVRLWAGVRWLRRLPLPTPWQATATGVAGAAALTIATPSTLTSGPDHPATEVGAGYIHDRDGVDQAASSDGVVVVGGWLPRAVADQVGVAVGLLWLRRRLAYRPRRASEDADDLAPLPATVAAIQAATTVRPDSPPPQPSAVVGVLPPGFPAAGVGLSGPGALAAARGLLVTVLLAALRQDSARLVITRRAAQVLLGPEAAFLRPGSGLWIADTVTHATTMVTAASQAAPSSPGGRSVLILDGPPPDTLVTEVATVVVLADWPQATTWHVAADGYTQALDAMASGPRVCVLDPVAAADLLTVTGHLNPIVRDARPQPVPQARIPRQPGPRHDGGEVGRRLRARVLGEPVLLCDGTPLLLRRTAARQALVFLAVHVDGVDSHVMAEALWPGLPAHRLTGRLYTTLSELRTAVRAATDLPLIDRTGDRYRLHPDHVDVDLWHLRAAAAHAASTLTDPATAWRAVIDAYTGDLAAGHSWPWLDAYRETARRLVLDAYTALADTEPDPRRALAHLQDGIRVDPYNADLHQRAVNILAGLGEHTAAADLAERYKRGLIAAGLNPDHVLQVALLHGRTT
ncbi:AfsR/SARP family transcriptional regulator [Micromonospora maris]|uniref:Bacterial transcriptional activator domain-containing protein n=1 Tax=Micromonospora maris TaxID=1003110 RepID=A0A9X0LFA1_9ACTN|nr:hypothetical protein [Micromonospora maris]AEB42651.1 hypothetical protein VAB18032_07655 [Micromonospora maris AB-18-032]KUJ48091.1 hypothetical protein ADL17_03135 [Micromonospora maris]